MSSATILLTPPENRLSISDRFGERLALSEAA
jgi:hypothetical protein